MIKNATYKVLFIIFFTLVFTACKVKDKTSLPMMEEDKMVEILTAMYVSEVKALQLNELGVQKDKFNLGYLYPVIFDSLDISDSLFYQSYEYYNNNPVALKEILDKVILQIEAMPIDTSVGKEQSKNLKSAYEELVEIENIKRDKAAERFENR